MMFDDRVRREQYHRLGMWDEAEQAFRDTLALVDENLGSHHPTVRSAPAHFSVSLSLVLTSLCVRASMCGVRCRQRSCSTIWPWSTAKRAT
jgi:hypothetical protein